MSIEDDYENLNGEIDVPIIRQYVNAGYHLSGGEVIGLLQEIEELRLAHAALVQALESEIDANARIVRIIEEFRAGDIGIRATLDVIYDLASLSSAADVLAKGEDKE